MLESMSQTVKLWIGFRPGGDSGTCQGNFTRLVTDNMKASLDPGLCARSKMLCDLFSREVAGAGILWVIGVRLLQKSGV